MTLREIGEDKLLARILPSLSRNAQMVVGPGDDCAAVRFSGATDLLLLKTDCVVERVHFAAGTAAERVGWKAIMRPLSDFAAMAGVPEFALVTIAISARRQVAWVRDFYRGANRAAARFEVAIVGGELSAAPGPIVVSVCISGRVEPKRCVLRSGGKPGDDLFVTGALGGSQPARHLRFVPRIPEARWLASNFPVHAMMDLSDGLGADLPRLARASGVGYEIKQKSLPLAPGRTRAQAISDGEDYELLFALSTRHRAKLERSWRKKFPRVRLTRIGRLVPRSRSMKVSGGYVHFRQRA